MAHRTTAVLVANRLMIRSRGGVYSGKASRIRRSSTRQRSSKWLQYM